MSKISAGVPQVAADAGEQVERGGSVVVEPSGLVRVVHLDAEPDHLAALYRELSCAMVEPVPLAGPSLVMWLDQEGIPLGRPVNEWASAVAAAFDHGGRKYLGAALFCAATPDTDFVDLQHDQLVSVLGFLGLHGADVVGLMVAAGVQVID